jgi:transketolase
MKHKPEGQPYAIIAETTKGKGVSFIENNKSWHQAVLNEIQYQQAVEEINCKL